MERNNKIMRAFFVVLSIISILFIALISRTCSDVNQLTESFKAEENTVILEFKYLNHYIFITKRKWGLGGQNFHTVISDINHEKENISIDINKELLLENVCGLYYKIQEPDSLFVIYSSLSDYDEDINYMQIGEVKIKVMKTKNSVYKQMRNNYKEFGWNSIYCD